MSRIRPAVLLIPVCVVLLGLAGCESERETPKVGGDTVHEATPVQDAQAATERELDALSRGRDPSKVEDSKAYDDAVAALIRRGSSIETTLIDRLRRTDDWSIRMGIIEVLMATGTKTSIDHLIFCLDDSEPLVALRANTTLQEMTNHAEIPASGSAKANGLPPVPKRADSDLALDAELRAWTAWHHEHGQALRAAWTAWWAENRDQITIK